MNAKLIEASIGMLARMVPPDAWEKIIAELNELVRYAKSADERLTKLAALAERVEFLENIVRNSVDGAPAAYAERELYMVPGTIEQALAPAQPGVINGRGTGESG